MLLEMNALEVVVYLDHAIIIGGQRSWAEWDMELPVSAENLKSKGDGLLNFSLSTVRYVLNSSDLVVLVISRTEGRLLPGSWIVKGYSVSYISGKPDEDDKDRLCLHPCCT
jgi:hypothetical protein